jgi:hypothetical protein
MIHPCLYFILTKEVLCLTFFYSKMRFRTKTLKCYIWTITKILKFRTFVTNYQNKMATVRYLSHRTPGREAKLPEKQLILLLVPVFSLHFFFS